MDFEEAFSKLSEEEKVIVNKKLDEMLEGILILVKSVEDKEDEE
jgi:hypothetical protein